MRQTEKTYQHHLDYILVCMEYYRRNTPVDDYILSVVFLSCKQFSNSVELYKGVSSSIICLIVFFKSNK